MDVQIIKQFYLFFSILFLINLIKINTNVLSIQCNIKNKYDYFNDYLYNKTHCLQNGQINIDLDDFINYEYCKICLKQKKKYCGKCSTREILKRLKIFSPEETLDEIINNNKSLTRYGDGEFELIFGNNINFQKYNKTLSKRLFNILQNNEENLLIGIPNSFNIEYLNNFKDYPKYFWRKWINKNKYKLIFLNKTKKYYSSFITRFYMDYKNNSNLNKYIKKLKKIWDKKDVLIIEGEKSRIGIGNDLFDNMKSISRIICPSINAFNIYDKILNESLKIDKNKLILISLGPSATILTYDLYKNGYQVIDIGHIDIEYEWYLRNTTSKIKIESKYVNEVKDGNKKIKKIKDQNYYNQIIAKIIN